MDLDGARKVLERIAEDGDLLEREGGDYAVAAVGKRGAVAYVPHGGLGYVKGRIGQVALRGAFERAGKRGAWTLKGTAPALHPTAVPTPGGVMNWLNMHSVTTLRDVIATVYPGDEPRSEHARVLKRYVGYRYQIAYAEATAADTEDGPAPWAPAATPETIATWKRSVRALGVMIQERGWPDGLKEGASKATEMAIDERFRLLNDGTFPLAPVDYDDERARKAVAAHRLREAEAAGNNNHTTKERKKMGGLLVLKKRAKGNGGDEAKAQAAEDEKPTTVAPADDDAPKGTDAAPRGSKKAKKEKARRDADKAEAKAAKKAAKAGEAPPEEAPKGGRASKAIKKARRSAASPDEYAKRKLDACKKLKVGAQYTYHGPNKSYDGKKATLESFEEGKGGIRLKFADGKVFLCSPFAVLKNGNGNGNGNGGGEGKSGNGKEVKSEVGKKKKGGKKKGD